MLPIGQMKFLNNRLTLIGNSRAGEATGFYIPELDLMLDAGFIVTSTKFRRLFVTHGHNDHSFEIPRMYSASSSNPLDIYVPRLSLSYFERYLSSAQILNDHDEEHAAKICKLRYTLHGVSEEETIDLDENLRVEIIRCHHKIPCVGYAFYEKRNKLKAEYTQLQGKQIQELKKQGIAVTEQVLTPLFAFLGDTTPEVFNSSSHSGRVLLGQMPVIICECSFLDGEQSDDKGHTHWAGLKPIVEQHPQTKFILIHFSLKHKRNEIIAFFENQSLKNVLPFVE